jgi:hypothetical protein
VAQSPTDTKRRRNSQSATSSNETEIHELDKRSDGITDFWELSQVTVPPNENWRTLGKVSGLNVLPPYLESYDTTYGAGQTIYVVEDTYDSSHSVS